MPDKAVSVFNYGTQRSTSMGPTIGSIWASSLPGGCLYDQYFVPIPYGGHWTMPLDYLDKIEPMEFEAIGKPKDRPVGAQMRP